MKLLSFCSLLVGVGIRIDGDDDELRGSTKTQLAAESNGTYANEVNRHITGQVERDGVMDLESEKQRWERDELEAIGNLKQVNASSVTEGLHREEEVDERMLAKFEAEQNHEADRFRLAMDKIRGNQSGLEFLPFEGAKYLHKSFDRDGNGYVTVDEIPTDMSGMDVDGDGNISIVELLSHTSTQASLLEISIHPAVSDRYHFPNPWETKPKWWWGKDSIKRVINRCYIRLKFISMGYGPMWRKVGQKGIADAVDKTIKAMERNIVVKVEDMGGGNAKIIGGSDCVLVIRNSGNYEHLGRWWEGLIGHEFAHCDPSLPDHPEPPGEKVAKANYWIHRVYWGQCSAIGIWNHGTKSCSNKKAGGCDRYKNACSNHYVKGSRACGHLGMGCQQECVPKIWCESYQDRIMIFLAGSGIYFHNKDR